MNEKKIDQILNQDARISDILKTESGWALELGHVLDEMIEARLTKERYLFDEKDVARCAILSGVAARILNQLATAPPGVQRLASHLIPMQRAALTTASPAPITPQPVKG